MEILNFDQVSLIRQKKVLLDQIDWQVDSGEDWAVLGLNGAGKTLMLQMIAGNLWPSQGGLTVLGEKFGETNIPDLTLRIGWVSNILQTKLHQSDIAEEIVLSGKFASIGIWRTYEEADLEKAKEILHSMQAESLIGKPYQVLSQGERQLVLIARALMAEPELLILDEPCNGLDLFAREDLLERIQELKKQPHAPAILFVTHHTEEILPFISHVLMLRDGQIFRQGPRGELLQETVLNDFYQRPIEIQQFTQERILIYPKETQT